MEYKRQQDVLNYEKLEDMLEGMPEFMRIFVDGCREDLMSSRSIIGYVGDLNTFFYYLEKRLHLKKSELTIRTLEELTPLELSGFKGFLQAYEKDGVIYQNGKAAINRKLVAVRQLYERLYNLDLIEKDPSRKLEFIPRKAEDREHHVIALDHKEVRELKDTVRRGTGLTQSQISYNRVNELRDDAIITLLLSTGIRVSECVGLDLEDVSLDKKTIRIIRKGRTKTQELHINDEAALALFRYITEGRRQSAIDPEALFISKKGQRITVRSVQRLVRKYAKASGTDKKISCHKLRSTYGTNLYEATRDLNAVAERLGHASIETSRTYVRSSSDIDKENASLDIYSEYETGDTVGRPPHSR